MDTSPHEYIYKTTKTSKTQETFWKMGQKDWKIKEFV